MGTGGGQGLWVLEDIVDSTCDVPRRLQDENPHVAEEGCFNAGRALLKLLLVELKVTMSPSGRRVSSPRWPRTTSPRGLSPWQEMYWPLFQALQKIGHPFAPRVGYLDLDDGKARVTSQPALPPGVA